jgi:hypothetical protein
MRNKRRLYRKAIFRLVIKRRGAILLRLIRELAFLF